MTLNMAGLLGGGKFNFLMIIVALFCTFITCHAHSNGGDKCAICTVIFGLIDQTAVIHNESAIKALERMCTLLPVSYQSMCKEFAMFIGPYIINQLDKDDTADSFCHKLGLCFTQSGTQECHLFPKKQQRKNSQSHRAPLLAYGKFDEGIEKIRINICDLPGVKQICTWINSIFSKHDPAVDLDGDRFSTFQTLRGFSWRGKDCDDTDRRVHPGARPLQSDRDIDSNCNGIKGADQSGKAYEDVLCAGTESRGVAVLGDSISAHFHLPREWFNSTELSPEVFKNLPYIIENELDWPAFSAVTGYMNATDTLKLVLHGDTQSVYHKLWQRNRCNFRDYQNIAVNGARSSSMDDIEKSFYRNKTMDYPVIVFYALVGNDVCNGHPDTIDHMTKPAEMKANAVKTLNFLEQTLPAGSHVFLSGLADGRVLYNFLHDRIHPIGSLHNDVKYSDYYTYFNCLQISPCTGWMNTNGTLRDLTTERAVKLSAVLKDLAHTQTFKNYKLYYTDNPLNQVVDAYEKAGGHPWELLEPVDGFHSNQKANALVGERIWHNLLTQYPDVLGKENPNNNKIFQLFGDQGGYM